ncbi:MAG: ABC transporter ATP-binding protein/permease [Bacilli bacterium]|nr:ABC transporter ATP-binding protein/permease [Bacilli bacterium]
MDEDLLKLHGDHPIPTGVLLKRTWKYVKPELKWMLLALFLIALHIVCDIITPIIFQNLIDLFKTEDPLKITMVAIFGLVGGGLILTVISQVFLYFESMILQKAGQRIIYNLRLEIFTHIENMSINQFNEMPVGSLVTRVCNYTTAMSEFFTNTIVSLIKNILMIIGVYSLMIYYSPILSLIMLGMMVLIFGITFITRHFISKEYRKERSMVSDLNSYISENLSGMKITQLFNQQKRKKEEFKDKNTNLRKQRFKLVSLFAIYRPSISFLFYASVAITFIVGVNLSLSAGSIVAFYLYLGRFFNPVQELADQLNRIQKAKTASERLYNLLDVMPQVLDSDDAIEVDRFEGKIEFKHVWFAYKDEDWILKDVSFTISPRTTCAFVGATGAGKTTILSLIVRNFEIQRGQILIDGIDIRKIKIESLRKAIGQMLQDVFLFSGTIKSNITLHESEFSDEEVAEACRYVNADSFIDKSEKGLETEVIEKGENFSQGQRQLLSFARTVLHKPQILILDEATANIDTETELLIQESLEKMKSIGTMLIVAHRLSTIQKADQIICLQNGKIVEKGTHQSLLKNKGYYYKLYLLQFEEK